MRLNRVAMLPNIPHLVHTLVNWSRRANQWTAVLMYTFLLTMYLVVVGQSVGHLAQSWVLGGWKVLCMAWGEVSIKGLWSL